MSRREVKFLDPRQTLSRAKASAKDVSIDQERRVTESIRDVDTPSVVTVNDANREFGGVTSMTRQAPDPGNRESLGSGGSMVAKLKLKGIDGRAPPGVEPAA